MARLRFRVEKLIRDHLPQIMRDQGLSVFERQLSDADFDAALRAKLAEEAAEVAASRDREELAWELADLSEVIHALADLHGLTRDDIETRRIAKRAERGGFDQRIYNAAVEADEGLPAADYYLARPNQYPRQT